jgi:predicted metal-binding membrane protein
MRLQREQTFILTLLLILAAASWTILIWQSRVAQGAGGRMGDGLTMGMGGTLFLAIWVVMMVAMMFPSVAPVILAVKRVQRDTGTERSAIAHMWVFAGAYLLIWTLFGGLAYLCALAAPELARQVPWIMMNAARISGGVVVLAGIYQLTPLKRVCLAQCRAPQNFILHSRGKGYFYSIRMGLKYGSYCLGSYWLLFVLLFPLGVMNIAAMALLTVLIFAEKCFSPGMHIAQCAALALILYGTLVIVVPAAFPLNGAGI